MNTYFYDKFNNIKFHSNILCIILRIKYLVKYVVLHVKSLRWMRPFVVFCHGSAEKVSMVTNHCFSAIVINFPYQFSIFVAVLAVKDGCSLIAVLLFPHWFHWSAASTLYAADRYFSAFPHGSSFSYAPISWYSGNILKPCHIASSCVSATTVASFLGSPSSG